jgi:hypothetical protein
MKHQNNVKYQGNFGGVAVTFTLQNFSQKVVEKFNEALAREVVKSNEEDKRISRVLC